MKMKRGMRIRMVLKMMKTSRDKHKDRYVEPRRIKTRMSRDMCTLRRM